MEIQIENSFINRYLEYVEDTESPRLFHIWCAIAAASACLGRRCHLDFGIGPLYPNLYTLLTGPPATRKSTALKIVEKLLRQSTEIKFAPEDTGGQRQGLITAMEEIGEDDKFDAELNSAILAADLTKLNGHQIHISSKDKHSMFICASEFNSVIGTRQPDIINFFVKLYDGDDYKYQLKNSKNILTEPLLNVLGATTATNIANGFPSEAIGQGFTSRIIFVAQTKKYKDCPRPKKLDPVIGEELEKCFRVLFYDFSGEISETPEAAKLFDRLYKQKPEIDDMRFIYYIERRHTHLIKTSMALAACRLSRSISEQDVEDAHTILTMTEAFMPDALGEFGLSPLAHAKQKLLEFMRHAGAPVPEGIIWAHMQRDMRHSDFVQSIHDLVNSGRIKDVMSNTYGRCYLYNDKDLALLQEMKVMQNEIDA